jgi:hypothetical protein
MCQLQSISEMERENTWANDKMQFCIWKFRYYRKKTLQFFKSGSTSPKVSVSNHDSIQPGDIVRVRLKDEIQLTLNKQRKTKGCTFQAGMYNYCGKEYRVFKKVENFFDETKQKMCKCSSIYLLEGAYCNGTTAYLHPCGRSCFYFWQSAWLEKVPL